jgi:Cys-rich protein (TIGR01571 family)
MQQCFAAMFQAAVFCALISVVGIAILVIMASRRRTAIRKRYGIDGTPMGDFCLWTWCAPCALAQVGLGDNFQFHQLCPHHIHAAGSS